MIFRIIYSKGHLRQKAKGKRQKAKGKRQKLRGLVIVQESIKNVS
jgi:hypothetical protein